ncbi:MAG TPA: deoxyribodipyrimidine photolyase, partial [Gammaproteobacteria bacterium]|nr:deoxyribodipyrimidine photolyase [Gammaproteobacteria bacterium]
MAKTPSLMWFRQDLRLNDNPALTQAAQAGPVLPIYILDDCNSAPWRMGAASRW